MKLNAIEYWLMNNPLRGLVQRHLEAPRLARLVGAKAERVLEIGCGQGTGAKMICEIFEPREYVGIDLDSRMIHRARRRGSRLPNATFQEGDAARLAFEDSTFDLVVDFGIVHHIPNWPDALAEVQRILSPGGVFLFEELSTETWETGSGRLFRKILEHPYDQMFSKPEFTDELGRLGFETELYEASLLGLLHFWGKATKRV